MSITAADVNKLRQMTGAGMMDCKKALSESNGNFEEAIDYLRKKGAKVSASRSDREAKEGVVITLTSSDRKTGVAIELNCETDFVAKNDEFIAFARQIAELALKNRPANLDALYALDMGGATIGEKILDNTGKIGEKLGVSKYDFVEGAQVISYIHGNYRLGVLVVLNQDFSEASDAAGKDVAMQIAAMNPVALSKEDVSQETLQREIEIGKDQARAEGKPEEMLEKIALGKLNKFFKDNTLLNQEFVKDNSKSISQMLDGVSKGLSVTAFKRVALGA
jgi:elongation factor Ts